MASGVYLPFQAIAAMSPAVRGEILEHIRTELEGPPLAVPPAPVPEESEEPADLSVQQANKFLARCSDKVRTSLNVIAVSDASGFSLSAIATALGVDVRTVDLRGVWGGITKRTRTVLGDEEADLIWWTKQGNEWIGHVSAMTHRSLRKALGL